jgi:hypothetical protein
MTGKKCWKKQLLLILENSRTGDEDLVEKLFTLLVTQYNFEDRESSFVCFMKNNTCSLQKKCKHLTSRITLKLSPTESIKDLFSADTEWWIFCIFTPMSKNTFNTKLDPLLCIIQDFFYVNYKSQWHTVKPQKYQLEGENKFGIQEIPFTRWHVIQEKQCHWMLQLEKSSSSPSSPHWPS